MRSDPMRRTLRGFRFSVRTWRESVPALSLTRHGNARGHFGIQLEHLLWIRSAHFSLVILSALIGGGFSTRKVLLHIAQKPGEPLGYGSPFRGMHLYTSGVLIFLGCIIGSANFLFVIRRYPQKQDRSPPAFEKLVFGFVALLRTLNVFGTVALCQFGPCCENGPCP
jgi:hypothetical protein